MKYKKIYIIAIGIMFSYWLGFTVLVPGSYWVAGAYDASHEYLGIDCILIQDVHEVPKGMIMESMRTHATGLIPPIEAHFFVSKLNNAVFQHIIYGAEMDLCFEYNDIDFYVFVKFSFDRYLLA